MSNPVAPNPAVPQPVAHHSNGNAAPETAIVAALGARSVVLVGMMGAGKSSIGRRLATRLGIPFVDADAEIEKAAGMIDPRNLRDPRRARFPRRRGARDRAPARRRAAGAGDRRRRLHECRRPAPRSRAKGISVWLKADFDVLMRRIKRRHDRPLLQDRRSGRDACGSSSKSAIRSMPRPTSRCSRATCRTTRSSTRSSRRSPAGSRRAGRAATIREGDHAS